MLNEREKALLEGFCNQKNEPIPTNSAEAKALQRTFEEGGVSTLPLAIFWLLEKFESENAVKKINPKKEQRAKSKQARSRWKS